MSDAGLAGHWELVLQLLDNKHHNVLTSERYAILEDLSGGGGRGGGSEHLHMDNYMHLAAPHTVRIDSHTCTAYVCTTLSCHRSKLLTVC